MAASWAVMRAEPRVALMADHWVEKRVETKAARRVASTAVPKAASGVSMVAAWADQRVAC
jgi:hypothetical protein